MSTSISHPLGVQIEIEIQSGSLAGEKLSFCNESKLLMGRHVSADVHFDETDSMISTRHIELSREENRYRLRDLDSTNGTYLYPCKERIQHLDLEPDENPYRIQIGQGGPICEIRVSNAIPFAHYNVIKQIGKGGMATVFLAREMTDLNRLVVLKLIHPDLLRSIDKEMAGTMLLEEARIVSQINHPNVVNIYDVGTDRGVHYIGMEYLRGVNLHDVQLQLQRLDRRCPYDLAAAIIGQGCLGLHAAHEARDVSGRQLGIVHRDFTPTNLVISPEGDVKLIDFGVARAVGRQYLSKDGQFVGKPAYASPEQILHPRQVTRTSDIFSAAIVLYELCSGRSLFMRDNTHATLFSVINDAVPPLHDIPQDMWDLLRAALTKDPAHRLQTGVAMATQLEQIVLAAGGRYLARGAIAEALQQLGVRLRAEPPQPIIGWPMIFPSRQQSKTSSTHVVTRSRRPKDVVLDLPCQIMVGGTEYSLETWLSRTTGSTERSYAAKYMAARVRTAELEGLRVRNKFALGLYGSTSPIAPLPEAQARRLATFSERWNLLNNHPENPFGTLWEHGQAWPEGPHYTVTPYYPHTLSSLKAGKYLPPEQRSLMARHICGALSAAVRMFAGYVHGRLTPARIAFPFMDVVIRPAASTATDVALLSSDLEWILGLPYPSQRWLPAGASVAHYLAPERLRGAAPSAAGDVYAIGAILYELFGGQLPLAAAAMASGAPLPVECEGRSIPDAVADAIVAALNPLPDRRPGAVELHRMLEESPSNGEEPIQSIMVPNPGETQTLGGGRKLVIYSMQLSRRDMRAPVLLPLSAVAGLLPAPLQVAQFASGIAVELAMPYDATGQRVRIYEPGDPTGVERLPLPRAGGSFEIGSRKRNWLLSLRYLHTTATPVDVELSGGCKVRLHYGPEASAGEHMILYTRDARNSIVHLVSITTAA